ncbi:iron-sulfur cluster assembly scaffold protein [Planctomycetes bacterium MalM25]|nr:iron-sulfur cluster assembly scaffold protein [Planctomycetes bacterium MalM25]
MDKPAWADKDKLGRAIAAEERLLKHGVVTWGAVVQANNALFQPGVENAPLQILYAIKSDVEVSDLSSYASRIYDLKEGSATNSEEAKIGEVLADEFITIYGKKLPQSLSGDAALATSAMYLCRHHLPCGYLLHGWFPILVEKRSGLAIVVPFDYWPEELLALWQRPINEQASELEDWLNQVAVANAGSVKRFLEFWLKVCRGEPIGKEEVPLLPVVLTESSANYLRDLCAQPGGDGKDGMLPIRVSVAGSAVGAMHTSVDYESEPIDRKRDVTYKHHGVQLVISRKALPYVMGTKVDYPQADGSHPVLEINNPNFD